MTLEMKRKFSGWRCGGVAQDSPAHAGWAAEARAGAGTFLDLRKIVGAYFQGGRLWKYRLGCSRQSNRRLNSER